MKRTFLTLPFALLAIVSACNPQPAGNGNGNQNANRPLTVEPITVVITLTTKPGTKTYHFSVSPDSVKLSISAGDQIRWTISNPPDGPDLTGVEIGKFLGQTTGKTDPFGHGPFLFASVGHGSVKEHLSGVAMAGSKDTYDYKVAGTAIVDGKPVPVTLDPVVIIDN